MREATLLVGLQATGTGCLAEQSRGAESEFLDFLAVVFGVRESLLDFATMTGCLAHTDFSFAGHKGQAMRRR